jgi:hypothetical protein
MDEFNHPPLDIIRKVKLKAAKLVMSSIRWFNSTSWSQWRFKLTHIIMSSIRWFNSTNWSQWRFKLTHIIMSSIRWFNSTSLESVEV